MTNRQDVAEDLVQDTFVYLWEHQPEFNMEQPYSYLRKAVITRTINWIKREQRIDLSDSAEELAELNSDPLPQASAPERWDAVRNAIESLPPKCRLIFRLNRLEGLTMAEIATYLSISPNTVENHIGKALRLLRNQLKQRG